MGTFVNRNDPVVIISKHITLLWYAMRYTLQEVSFLPSYTLFLQYCQHLWSPLDALKMMKLVKYLISNL